MRQLYETLPAAETGAMAYNATGLVVHDADAHIMKTPNWLRDRADPSVRERIALLSYPAWQRAAPVAGAAGGHRWPASGVRTAHPASPVKSRRGNRARVLPRQRRGPHRRPPRRRLGGRRRR